MSVPGKFVKFFIIVVLKKKLEQLPLNMRKQIVRSFQMTEPVALKVLENFKDKFFVEVHFFKIKIL